MSVCARSCSVIYLVPYIHSDNLRWQPTRDRIPAFLHERRTPSTRLLLRPQDASLPASGWAWVSPQINQKTLKVVLKTTLQCGLWNVFRDLYSIFSRYTGSYNYSSYANQHHHAIQSQYSSLTHEPGLPTPLHYSSYHRTSAQVRLFPLKILKSYTTVLF